jgi:UDP-glucuronate decarboxylase
MNVLQFTCKGASRAGRRAARDKAVEMAEILVTGGAGFLGSHLTARLLEQGHQVTVLDDMSTGRLSNLPAHPHLTVVAQDICQGYDRPFDRIYHLACPASPPKYQIDPVQTLRTCFTGTQLVLELAKQHGARVLFTSTSEVYGNPTESPQRETYWGRVNSFGPRSCYDEGKRVAESLCYSYALHHGVTVRIARIFNTYGPQMDPEDGRVVSNFINQALRGEPLTVYGDGSQTRSLCYVDDLVRGLLLLMDAPGGALEHPCNLGNPHELTMLELAEAVLQMTGSASTVVHRPLPQDDPLQRKPDISRAKQWLNWEPEIPLQTGLQRTIAYFSGNVSEPVH